MRALALLLWLSVGVWLVSNAHAECRVSVIVEGHKRVECDNVEERRAVVSSIRSESRLAYGTSGHGVVGSTSAPQAMAKDYYAPYGGYHQGMQLQTGKGFYTWYK